MIARWLLPVRIIAAALGLTGMLVGAGRARAGDRVPDSYGGGTPPPARVHSQSETEARVRSVVANPQFNVLRTYLVDKGFTPRTDLSASGETISQGGPDDGEIVLIPFQARPGDDRTAVLHYGRRGSNQEWGATILKKSGDDVVADEKVVLNASGAVVPANSWWDCFKVRVAILCGAAVVGCFALWWAGANAVITCAVALCGSAVIAVSIYCIGR